MLSAKKPTIGKTIITGIAIHIDLKEVIVARILLGTKLWKKVSSAGLKINPKNVNRKNNVKAATKKFANITRNTNNADKKLISIQ